MSQAAPKENQQTLVVASTTLPLAHKRIQNIQPGQWVRADNPSDEEDDTAFGKDVDPATWKLLKLKAPKLDGSLADVSLIRPEQWLTQQAATVGGTVYISVPECGIDGNAKVLAIEGCPPIAVNPGQGFQVVTGTFQHQAAKTLDIAVEGESKPIGTTPNHPIWSVDRQAFVRADSLTVGERLQSLNGVTTVTSISPRGPPEPVYNLEVQVKHTYYVADTGVLVHNGSDDYCTVIYRHYTNKGGYESIMKNGLIRANKKNKVYLTKQKVSAKDSLSTLFAGNPKYKGKGNYVIELRLRKGTQLEKGTQINELIHSGSIRDGRLMEIISHGLNPF